MESISPLEEVVEHEQLISDYKQYIPVEKIVSLIYYDEYTRGGDINY